MGAENQSQGNVEPPVDINDSDAEKRPVENTKPAKALKYNCVVCELCDKKLENFVAFEPCDPIFETQEEWERRRKSHIRSLCSSAGQKDMSWKLCKKHQEALQEYLMVNHADELMSQSKEEVL